MNEYDWFCYDVVGWINERLAELEVPDPPRCDFGRTTSCTDPICGSRCFFLYLPLYLRR